MIRLSALNSAQIEDRHGRKLYRTTYMAGRVAGAPPLFGGLAMMSLYQDTGTRIVNRIDVRGLMAGTSIWEFKIEAPIEPFVRPTRMARIRDLAPLSLREWATVFRVSHSAIRQWTERESDQAKSFTILTI